MTFQVRRLLWHGALIGAGVGMLWSVPVPVGAQAQPGEQVLRRASDLENAGQYREAIAAYREALRQGAVGQGVLGLERAFSALGQEDSLFAALDTLLRTRPRDAVLQGARLRILRAVGRDADARRAFEQWRASDPKNAAPYREYVHLLLSDRRTERADSILRLAVEAIGDPREFATDFAELYATMGRWGAAAAAWRDALTDEPYYDQSAVFSLMSAPAPARDDVRRALVAPPRSSAALVASVARTRGWLELRWGAPRDAWRALSTLPAADSTAQLWIDFAEEAAHFGGALAARDALEAAYAVRKDPALAFRAASASLVGGDPASALRLLAAAASGVDSARFSADGLPLAVRALAEQGNPREAERQMTAYARFVTDGQRRLFARSLAWGWIRAGDIARARQSAAQGGGEEEDVVSGWLALFDGDLEGARAGLRTAEPKSLEVVTALAFISRAAQPRVPAIGGAFLALARGDSVRASRAFEAAADGVPAASSFVLALAARIASAQGDETRALALWTRLVEQFGTAPEAPEADLEWARVLERRGDRAAATARYEHLILTWPDSALVPQARAALDRLRLNPNGGDARI